MPVEMPSYVSSEVDEEYFEDDLIGGLNHSYSIMDMSSSNGDAISNDDDEPSSDQLEMRALERMAIQNKSASIECIDRVPSPSEKMHPPDISDKNNNLNDSFLFDEKASNDGIDKATLQKVKVCFDGQRIKDLYMLSGRLQDIISQEEIEEILSNAKIYSEFIDDEIIEALASKCRSNRPKQISMGTTNDDERHRDECRIRAVFEQHCRGQTKGDVSNELHGKKQAMLRHEVTTNCSNIRAFFEESLVKSASTLKIIHAKIDDSDEASIELSVSPSTLSVLESGGLCQLPNI